MADLDLGWLKWLWSNSGLSIPILAVDWRIGILILVVEVCSLNPVTAIVRHEKTKKHEIVFGRYWPIFKEQLLVPAFCIFVDWYDVSVFVYLYELCARIPPRFHQMGGRSGRHWLLCLGLQRHCWADCPTWLQFLMERCGWQDKAFALHLHVKLRERIPLDSQ